MTHYDGNGLGGLEEMFHDAIIFLHPIAANVLFEHRRPRPWKPASRPRAMKRARGKKVTRWTAQGAERGVEHVITANIHLAAIAASVASTRDKAGVTKKVTRLGAQSAERKEKRLASWLL